MPAPGEVQATAQQITGAQPSNVPPDTPTHRELLKRKEPHDGFEEEETVLYFISLSLP